MGDRAGFALGGFFDGVGLPPSRRWSLYRHGALMVTGAALPAGCLDWSRA